MARVCPCGPRTGSRKRHYMHFGDTVEPGSDGFLTQEVDFFDRYSTWRRSR